MNFKTKGVVASFNENAGVRLLLAGVFLILFTLGIREINSGPSTAPDFPRGQAGVEVLIEVLPGEAGGEIAKKLEQAGVVKSSLAFFRVAVSDKRSLRIAPGEHLLQTQIPAQQALEQLLDPDRIPNLIRVRDGARWSEINQQLLNFGVVKSDLVKAVESFKAPEPFDVRNIEGFIYPAQYSFNKTTSAKQMIGDMVDKFEWMTKSVNWNALPEFTPYEVLVMASLIESEGTPDVFSKVARVIQNRLKIGMPLQFDSTVHYALDRRGEIRVSIAETKTPSEFNTFINKGLPPTPIGSPTIAAINAALNPANGDWIYFVTVKPGVTRFTSSYEEFLDWKAEYKRNFRAGLFK